MGVVCERERCVVWRERASGVCVRSVCVSVCERERASVCERERCVCVVSERGVCVCWCVSERARV